MEGGVECCSSSSSVSEGRKENCSDMVFLIIECSENSYSISKKGIDQSQQIVLSRLEWVEFIKLCDPVIAYMRGETLQSKKEEEISWSLATENSSGVETWTTVSTKIHLSHVERVPYCNIAVYEGSTPSDQGVTLDRSECEQVRISTARSSSFNVHLAVMVYRALLKDAIMRALPERCEGCKRNRVDVMKHECHVDKDRLIHRVAKELADTAVPPYDFQCELADLANHRDEELELSPAYLYNLCNYLFRPWCVDVVCDRICIDRFGPHGPVGHKAASYIRNRSTQTCIALFSTELQH